MERFHVAKNIDCLRLSFPEGVSTVHFRLNTPYSDRKVCRILLLDDNFTDLATGKISNVSDLNAANMLIDLVNREQEQIVLKSHIENWYASRRHYYYHINDYIDWRNSSITKRADVALNDLLLYIFYDEGATIEEFFYRAFSVDVPANYNDYLYKLVQTQYTGKLRAIEPAKLGGIISNLFITLRGKNGENCDYLPLSLLSLEQNKRTFLFDLKIDWDNSKIINGTVAQKLTFYFSEK